MSPVFTKPELASEATLKKEKVQLGLLTKIDVLLIASEVKSVILFIIKRNYQNQKNHTTVS